MRRLLVLVFCLLLPLTAVAIDALQFNDRAEEKRFQNLASQLRCLVCQNESLADSNAELAKDLRREVFDQMRSGKSDDQIKHYLVARYSEFVLYNPPVRPGTWLLWFGPLAVFLIGAGSVVAIVRRRSRDGAMLAQHPSSGDSGDDW